MNQGRRMILLRFKQSHCGRHPSIIPEFHEVCQQCTTQVHPAWFPYSRILPGPTQICVWFDLSMALKRQSGYIFCCLAAVKVLVLIKAHPLQCWGCCLAMFLLMVAHRALEMANVNTSKGRLQHRWAWLWWTERLVTHQISPEIQKCWLNAADYEMRQIRAPLDKQRTPMVWELDMPLLFSSPVLN